MGNHALSPDRVSAPRVPASRLQAEAVAVGWVDGVAVPKTLVEQRLAQLRGGPLAALLPRDGTAEGRQLVRWAAQVVLVEALCRAEAARRGGPAVAGSATRLDRRAAIEFGSVVTAAWERCEAVRWLAGVVPGGDGAADPPALAGAAAEPAAVEPAAAGRPRSGAGVGSTTGPKPTPENAKAQGGSRSCPGGPGRVRVEYAVRHALASDPAEPSAAAALDLQPMGWVTADELPPAVAGLLPEPGEPIDPATRLGPAQSSLGWHVIAVDQVREVRVGGEAGESDGQSERRRAFLRWLAAAMAERVVAAPGFEHPGDPRQPDNHHQH